MLTKEELLIKPTSHSELSRLANCEMSWWLRYVEGVQRPSGPAAQKGTIVHLGAAALWSGYDWRRTVLEYIVKCNNPEASDAELYNLANKADLNHIKLNGEKHVSDALWLLDRYVKHYKDFQGTYVVESELDITADIPGTGGMQHRAIIDQLVMHKGHLWMLERKTYGRKDRLDYLTVDPQLTLNLWVARQNGYDVVGIIFDGIYTYRWAPSKPTQRQLLEDAPASVRALPKAAQTAWARDAVANHPGIERPTTASFSWLYEYRNDEHIEHALDAVRAGISRRTDLLTGTGSPMRNIGQGCSWCDQRQECYSRLSFDQDVFVDTSDEDD